MQSSVALIRCERFLTLPEEGGGGEKVPPMVKWVCTASLVADGDSTTALWLLQGGVPLLLGEPM